MDKQIEKIYLDDGRMAERHISTNEQGEQVIEVFVEPKKTLVLDRRVINKHKPVLSEQIIETIQDGQVVDRKVLSSEPNTKMQVVEHIGVAAQSETKKYLTAEEVGPMITDAVVAGVQSVIEAQGVAPAYSGSMGIVSAQSIVEERQEGKKNNNTVWIGAAVFAFLIQAGFLGYVTYVNFFAN